MYNKPRHFIYFFKKSQRKAEMYSNTCPSHLHIQQSHLYQSYMHSHTVKHQDDWQWNNFWFQIRSKILLWAPIIESSPKREESLFFPSEYCKKYAFQKLWRSQPTRSVQIQCSQRLKRRGDRLSSCFISLNVYSSKLRINSWAEWASIIICVS